MHDQKEAGQLGRAAFLELAVLATAVAVALCSTVGAQEPVDSHLIPCENEGGVFILQNDPNYLWLYMRAASGTKPKEGLRLTVSFPKEWTVAATPFAPDEKVSSQPNSQGLVSRSYDVTQFVTGDRPQRLCFLVTTSQPVGSTGEFAWQVEGGRLKGARYEVIPPIPAGPRPKRITTGAFFCSFYKVEPKHVPQVARFLGKTGLNLYWDYDPSRVAQFRKAGLRVGIEEVGAVGLGESAVDLKDAQITVGGKLYKLGGCPQAAVESNGKSLKVVPWLKKTARTFDLISLDWEWGFDWAVGQDIATGHWCVCPRCMDAFAREFGIDRAGLPNITRPIDESGEVGPILPEVEKLFAKHRDDYVLFRNLQYSRVMSILYRAVNEANPKAQLMWLPCSAIVRDPYASGWQATALPRADKVGTYFMNTSRWDEKAGRVVGAAQVTGRGFGQYLYYSDIPKAGECIDYFTPMFYGRGGSQIRQLIEQLEAAKSATDMKVVPCLWGAGTIEEMSGEYTPGLLRSQLLASAITADGGVFYPFFAGGKTWHAVTDACREIAQVEPMLVEGRNASSLFYVQPQTRESDSAIADDVVWRAKERNGEYLVAVFSLRGDKPVRVKLQAYLKFGQSYEALTVDPNSAHPTGAIVYTATDLRRGLGLELPADYGVRLIVLRPVRGR
jgi:hypothetical protein